MKPAHALAWRMECSNDLTVTIVVVDNYILLLSRDGAASRTPWRIGTYLSRDEAHRRAVEMTSSYERLRKGTVTTYADVLLPLAAWQATIDQGAVETRVEATIVKALSPEVSPAETA